MTTDASITRDEQKPDTQDKEWGKVKERLHVGQIIQGTVEAIKVYGAFFDVGESFPAFLDVLDTSSEPHSEPFEIEELIELRVIGFTDWNREIRVVLTDKRKQRLRLLPDLSSETP